MKISYYVQKHIMMRMEKRYLENEVLHFEMNYGDNWNELRSKEYDKNGQLEHESNCDNTKTE